MVVQIQNIGEDCFSCPLLFRHLGCQIEDTEQELAQLTLRKDPLPLATVATSDKPWRSHNTHHVLTQ